MLDTAAHLPILFHIVALKAMDLCRSKAAVQIWIFAGGLHDTPPARVADEVNHRREDNVDSCGRCLACGDRSSPFAYLRVKGSALRDRSRKNRAVAVDDIHHKQKRDMMRMPVYIGILNLHQCSRNPSYFHRIISAGILQVNQAGIRILLLRGILQRKK